MLEIKALQESAIDLLRGLIINPSFSGQEEETAELISVYLKNYGVEHIRKGNNIIAGQEKWKEGKPCLLLNSHHDTVKVVNGWSHDPFGAQEEEGKIFGLGSNDAGASLVSLIACFVYFYKKELPFNVMLAASAEEENFGPNGVKSIISSELSQVDFGIVGEPTNMEMAVAEKGLIVIDAVARGVAGHAARKEGENAIYKATKDISKIENFEFDKISETLGPNVVSVTQVNAGVQHNVVPDSCHFVLDVRVNEKYTLEEAFEVLSDLCEAELKERSFNNRSSGIPSDHPLVASARALGIKTFGSATLSDQANMSFPTIKMGPGFSERSHTPNEFIYKKEIEEGILGYISLLNELAKQIEVKS
jgi:acetylornithine deacetylase